MSYRSSGPMTFSSTIINNSVDLGIITVGSSMLAEISFSSHIFERADGTILSKFIFNLEYFESDSMSSNISRIWSLFDVYRDNLIRGRASAICYFRWIKQFGQNHIRDRIRLRSCFNGNWRIRICLSC